MAQLTPNLRQTYGAVGIREDLSDIIYNISPMDTPFMNGIGKGTCNNTQFEWQTDELTAAASNRQVEGDSPDAIAVSEPRRLSNYTQISHKTVMTSGTAEAVDFAGRRSSQAYQLAKRAKEIKRDMEKMLLDNTVKNAGAAGSPPTPRATGGFNAWIGTSATGTSNIIDGSASPVVGVANAGSPSVGYPDGSSVGSASLPAAALTLDMINLAVSRVWDLGGTPDVMMCSGALKQTISGLGASVVADLQKNVGDSAATAVNAVDVLVTDFGTFKIVPNRFCLANQVYIIDYDLWSLDYLRPFKTENLAKDGDGIKQMMIAEYGLRAKNGNGNGLILGVS
jgi:hypothetical protein